MPSMDMFLGAGAVVVGIALYFVMTKGWTYVSGKVSAWWTKDMSMLKSVTSDLQGRVTALEGKVGKP